MANPNVTDRAERTRGDESLRSISGFAVKRRAPNGHRPRTGSGGAGTRDVKGVKRCRFSTSATPEPRTRSQEPLPHPPGRRSSYVYPSRVARRPWLTTARKLLCTGLALPHNGGLSTGCTGAVGLVRVRQRHGDPPAHRKRGGRPITRSAAAVSPGQSASRHSSGNPKLPVVSSESWPPETLRGVPPSPSRPSSSQASA